MGRRELMYCKEQKESGRKRKRTRKRKRKMKRINWAVSHCRDDLATQESLDKRGKGDEEE
jgi:hypothetical protein